MIVELPQPYDFALSTERFRAFGPDLANLWYEGGLHRFLRGEEVRIEAAPGGVEVDPVDEGIAAAALRMLGADFDLDGFRALAGGDPVLARLLARLPGFRPPLQPDPLEALVTSITAQQVSLRSAAAVRNRLIEAFGKRGRIAWAFPTARRLARAEAGELVALGLSARKAGYVIGLARAEPPYAELEALPDEEVKARLTSLRGIGEWTADWYLARHLGRPRAWPAGDLGLRRAVSSFYRGGVAPSTDEVRAFGARFAPCENLAAQTLLAALRVVGA